MSDQSAQQEFTAYTPLYHKKLDTWGLSHGTRVWMSTGSFKAVQDVKIGDKVLGMSFEKAQVGVGDRQGADAIQVMWRPCLVNREVLGRRVVEARAWQLTFGDHEKQHQTRRLVGGGNTHVRIFPDVPYKRATKALVRLHTALENPRVRTLQRKAMKPDKDWSEQVGEMKYVPTPLSGTPRGNIVMTMPYEAYGGAYGLFETRTRDYNRYGFAQAREVTVLAERIKLVQLLVKPDTTEDSGVFEHQRPRANIIAQTPFAPEEEEHVVVTNPKAEQVHQMTAAEDRGQWENYVDSHLEGRDPEQSKPIEVEGQTTSMKVQKQGSFYESMNDEDVAEQLERYYGIKDGFLDGGIVVQLPVPDQIIEDN